jgi:cell division protein FtsZ
MIELENLERGPKIDIKVVGVGGGGGNAVNTMIESDVQGVSFVVANTDLQVLERNLAPRKVQLGQRLTRGLGAGANPEIGRAAALEDQAEIVEALRGADMVFITAGMGGGTGTGASPVIAQAAKELGALCVAVVTKPFPFEMKKKMKQAVEGIEELRKTVDALIVIPNARLINVVTETTSLKEAFKKVDQVLLHAVQSITDLILVPGLINVDFADARRVLAGQGMALMGTGRASGSRRALEAAQQATASPLLEGVTIEGATKVLINFTGGPGMTLLEVHEAAALVEGAAHDDAEVIFGAAIDPAMHDEVKVTVIATGFETQESPRARAPEVVQHPLSTRREAQPTQAASSRASWHNDLRREPLVGLQPSEEEELDIPTFLRRQPNRGN